MAAGGVYELNERIRKLRRLMKLTQADFATRFGVTRDIVASWENGRVEPSEAIVRLVCREFGVNYAWLKNGDEPINVPDHVLTMQKLERIMNGNNEFVKAVFRELADLPDAAWEQVGDFVSVLYTANQKGR
jgi:transcriptional regulator with XRE-family HTH domain